MAAETLADMRERLTYLITGHGYWWWREQVVKPSFLWVIDWPRAVWIRWRLATRSVRCSVCRRVYSDWFTTGSIGGSAGDFCSERCYQKRWGERH